MSEQPRVFLFLPGIVAGLIFAAVTLAVWSVAYPHAFEKVVPPHALLFVGSAIAATSVVGLVNLLFTSRRSNSRSENQVRGAKNSSGGTRVR